MTTTATTTSRSRAMRRTYGECASSDGRPWRCSSVAGGLAGGRRSLSSRLTSTIRGRLGAKNSPRRFRREDGAPAAEEDEVDGRLMKPTGRGQR